MFISGRKFYETNRAMSVVISGLRDEMVPNAVNDTEVSKTLSTWIERSSLQSVQDEDLFWLLYVENETHLSQKNRMWKSADSTNANLIQRSVSALVRIDGHPLSSGSTFPG